MKPGPIKSGPRNLITDVSGLLVGNASDAALKSGVTVLTGSKPFTAAVSVMGGAPGTRETDLLAPDKTAPGVDALVLSGGSVFGLDAASGVTDALREAGRGFAVGSVRAPIVPAAILFDLLNDGDKAWSENPYRGLGHRAFAAARRDFALGAEGAGRGATTATGPGGLGSASVVLANGVTVGALVAVNPVGTVQTPNGHYWAAPFEIGAEFGGLGPDPAPLYTRPVLKTDALQERANTTIAIVATDASLDKAQAHRMATAAQDGIARAIVPAHTPFDGDLVFAAATGENPAAITAFELTEICMAAGFCLSRAIARGVYAVRGPLS